MTYTQEQIDAIRAKNQRYYSARQCLENELRKVLDSPNYNFLSNESKAEVLLDLENGGEYDPFG